MGCTIWKCWVSERFDFLRKKQYLSHVFIMLVCTELLMHMNVFSGFVCSTDCLIFHSHLVAVFGYTWPWCLLLLAISAMMMLVVPITFYCAVVISRVSWWCSDSWNVLPVGDGCIRGFVVILCPGQPLPVAAKGVHHFLHNFISIFVPTDLHCLLYTSVCCAWLIENWPAMAAQCVCLKLVTWHHFNTKYLCFLISVFINIFSLKFNSV